VQNRLCCYHDSHSEEVDLDTPTGSTTRTRFFGLAIWLIFSRFMGAVATLKLAHAMWIEKSILRNVAFFFGALFVYVATQPLLGAYFNLPQLAVSCLGVLLPPLALWRLRRTRNTASILVKDDQAKFGLLYQVLLSQPDTLVSLDRIGLLCAPFPSNEQTFHQMTSVDTDSHFAHQGKAQMHNGRLCEPMRSIDQLYLQAKLLVPFFSKIMRKWSRNANCLFKVKLLAESVETVIVSMNRSRVHTRSVSHLHTRLLGAVADAGNHLFRNSLFARSMGREINKSNYAWEKWADLKVIHTATKMNKLVYASKTVGTAEIRHIISLTHTHTHTTHTRAHTHRISTADTLC